MIEIINKRGEVMELASNMAIPYEKNNTLFNGSDVFVEDLMYPGNAPLTPINKVFFGGGHRIDADPSVYEFEVSMFLNSAHICSGILTYKLSDKGFDFTIKPNFASVRAKATTYNFPAVKFYDILYTPMGKTYAQVMKEMATSPNDFPCVFVPVKNPYQFEEQTETNAYPFVNNWTNNNFTPSAPAGVDPFNHLETPFFSLNYILKKCCEFLGFKTEGSIFTDTEFLKKKIYSRVARINPTGEIVFVDSTIYMPDMLISDFFKQIGARYNLSFVFDFNTSTVFIHTFSYLKNQSKVHDLTHYLAKTKEVNAPDFKGYTISLKPDESDEEFVVEETTSGTTTPVPERPSRYGNDTKPIETKQSFLSVGDGLAGIELDVSTLKTETAEGKTILKVNQLLRDANNFKPNLTPKLIGTPRPRDSYDNYYNLGSTVIEDTPSSDSKLRIFNYEGLVEYESGKFWPQSTDDDLTEKDALFYNFMRTSKSVKAIFTLPSTEFSKINVFDRIAFFCEYGTYHIFLIQRILTDIKPGTFIPVEMLLRLIAVKSNNYEVLNGAVSPSAEDYNVTVQTDFIESIIIPFQVWILLAEPDFVFHQDNFYVQPGRTPRGGLQTRGFKIPKSLIAAGEYFQIRFYERRPVSASNALGATITVTNNGAYHSVNVYGSETVLFHF